MTTSIEISTEEWREIPGFEGSYEASSLGNIRRFCNKKNLALAGRHPDGSVMASLYGDVTKGQKYGYRSYAHRMIACTFIPNPDNLECVTHINGDKTDNRVSNLKWVSKKEIHKPSGNTKTDKLHPKNTTGYCGVSKSATRNTFRAQITIDKKIKYIGDYRTAEEAHKAIEIFKAIGSIPEK